MIREEQEWPRAATKFVIAFALLSLVFLNNDITLARIEEQLAKARGEIHKAIVEKSLASRNTNGSYIREGTIYKNPFAFFQSHTEMIKTFKIWSYKEGEIPFVHNGPMKYVYSVEGDFIEEMERKGNPMGARHPDEAHAFFIPISITNIIYYLFKPDEAIGFKQRIQAIVEDYIGVIAERYPYWNHSNGADHFFVSCHDWGPSISLGNPKLFKNFIRVLCNANSSEGFIPIRDVSMSEINGPFDNIPQFSVQIPVDKIPEIKRILQKIPFSKYLEMQKKVIEVQRHFIVNLPAKHFDVLHMILHSVWLRRLNVQLNSFNSP
ncbi:hypothetical protein L1987_50002 [Smallanthus sonchifolius]|uniref:Uncharacterized protein n=1 Tax=Smallanthus sonchifolius TaxID=185202 RepID=A0ACB9FX77_9ASTR|nr:hypothetical protein L1987_50002 [Smallanthus sonchifolius]